MLKAFESSHRKLRPLELYPVTVREINGTRGQTEAFNCTPVVDIKSAPTRADG